jgi:hypothetical protein
MSEDPVCDRRHIGTMEGAQARSSAGQSPRRKPVALIDQIGVRQQE